MKKLMVIVVLGGIFSTGCTSLQNISDQVKRGFDKVEKYEEKATEAWAKAQDKYDEVADAAEVAGITPDDTALERAKKAKDAGLSWEMILMLTAGGGFVAKKGADVMKEKGRAEASS